MNVTMIMVEGVISPMYDMVLLVLMIANIVLAVTLLIKLYEYLNG